MRRRNFIQQVYLQAVPCSCRATLLSEETYKKPHSDKPFKLNYAFHDGHV